jgi:hypothetical protein
MEIFITNEVSRRYNNRRRFDSSTPTQAHRFENRASVIQTVKETVQLFRKKYTEDVTVVQQLTRVVDSSMCIEHIINPA